MTTVRDFWDKALEQFPECKGCVCDFKTTFCPEPESQDCYSKIEVLDFDKVMAEKCKGGDKRPSVDAILPNTAQTALLFVEKKSWLKFFKYNSGKKSAHEKVEDYDLQGKFNNSKNACCDIADDKNLFKAMPIAFVFLSDINPHTDPENSLWSNLSALATTSNDISVETEALDATNRALTLITCRNKHYVYCKDFDSFVNNYAV